MKLSKKMLEVMDILNNAEPYYKDSSAKCDYVRYLHLKDRKRVRNVAAHIVESGNIVLGGHTSTLKALEKRGLIEIVNIGGDSLDEIKYTGKTFDEFLTKLVKVNVYRVHYYNDKAYEQNLEEYAEIGTAPESIEAHLSELMPSVTFKATITSEIVEVTVWDYKN